jgi:hypothetical protein
MTAKFGRFVMPYLVKSGNMSATDIKTYYDCIEKIGYQRTTCHLQVPQNNGSIELKDAEGGLLETELDAKSLLRELEKALPEYEWQIIEKPHSEKITWYRRSRA